MTEPLDHPPAAPARSASAAGALLFDATGRILVVRPSYKPTWEIPGGMVEAGESPRQACIREVDEELGLSVEPGPLLVVDWAPSDRDGDKLLFVFDGGTIARERIGAIRLQESELLEYAFREPTDLADIMIDRLARRLAVAAAVRTSGGTAYLEHGRTVAERAG